MEKDLRGGDVATELSLHLKEGLGGAEGQHCSNFCSCSNLQLETQTSPDTFYTSLLAAALALAAL